MNFQSAGTYSGISTPEKSNQDPDGITLPLITQEWNTNGLATYRKNVLAFGIRQHFDTNPLNNRVFNFPQIFLVNLSELAFSLTKQEITDDEEVRHLKESVRSGDLNFWGLFRNANTEVGYKRIKTQRSQQKSLLIQGVTSIPNIWAGHLKAGDKLYLSIEKEPSEEIEVYHLATGNKQGKTEYKIKPRTNLLPAKKMKSQMWFFIGTVLEPCSPSYDGLDSTFQKKLRSCADLELLKHVTVYLDISKGRITQQANIVPQKNAGKMKGNKGNKGGEEKEGQQPKKNKKEEQQEEQEEEGPIIPESFFSKKQTGLSLLDLEDDTKIESFVKKMAERSKDVDATHIPHVTSYIKEKIRPGGKEALDAHKLMLSQDLNWAYYFTIGMDNIDNVIKKYQPESNSEGRNAFRLEKLNHLTKMKEYISKEMWGDFKDKIKTHIGDLLNLTKKHNLPQFGKILSDEYTVKAIDALKSDEHQQIYDVTKLEMSMAKIYSKQPLK
jgi:hypothetical protein